MYRLQDQGMRNWLIALVAAAVLFGAAWYYFGDNALNGPSSTLTEQN
ncbi:hypothetical protein [Pararhizobium haloflavum]|nr:hypothetical protein [Pararhizobium haloflavum]